MDKPQDPDLLSLPDYVLAHAICEACGEEPMHLGDTRGNDWRWQDYLECVPQFKQSIRHYLNTGNDKDLARRIMEDCECKNWCQDGRDMYAAHHYNCQHYTPPPTDLRFARFGEAMWKYIDRLGGDFCGEEISEDILPIAADAGLCCRVPYDSQIHGEDIDAEQGDEIWWWGDWNIFLPNA